MKKYVKIFLLITILNFSIQATKKKVENLFGDLYKGDIYSGYLKTKIDGNELFYMYMPSQNDTSKDPIILWLNGGPGCSSLFGLLGEVGPVVEDNFAGEFKTNPYSWNNNANLLAIEQPAGVGFSKTIDPKFEWTDDVTAENLLFAIKDFLNAFEDLKGRPFHISGESYAGVYIPFLATHMLEDTAEDKVNLAGILVGNGLTAFDTDVERSMSNFAFTHGLISIELYENFKRNCLRLPDELDPHEVPGNEKNDGFYPRNVTHKCNEIRKEMHDLMGGLDIYGIYRICPPKSRFDDENDGFSLNRKYTMKKTIIERLLQYKYQNNNLNELEPEEDIFPDGCGEDLTFDRLLNNETVKKNLGVWNESIIWTQCSPVTYKMSESIKFYNETMLKYPNVKVWVFSGTEDGVLPTLGTMRWINKLNMAIETKWKQWKVGDQVAGYVQKYKEGVVIVTVKGAGHMVPQDQHASAYNMVTAFLNGVLP